MRPYMCSLFVARHEHAAIAMHHTMVLIHHMLHHLTSQKYPKPVATANTKNRTPPMYPTVFSEIYWEAIDPLMTAMAVAIACPKIAPVATPVLKALELTVRHTVNSQAAPRHVLPAL